MFQFIHAADIHLDSPLRGLERYEGAPVREIRDAARRALENLVDLALSEKVAFVVIAGDVYDGDWPDYNTGHFFIKQMSRLSDASIPTFLIAGNHDAVNRMTRWLKMPPGVTFFGSDAPQSVVLDEIGVAVHGQSFATQAVREDLSREYPLAAGGLFNLGVLHTCATGSEGHADYAPCTIEGLRSKNYDYWALGHIHLRQVLSESPYIAFSGNLQGRHVRETGPKGCLLVTVADDRSLEVDFRPVDVLRWEIATVDVTACETGHEVLDTVRHALERTQAAAEGRTLAVRVVATGASPAHRALVTGAERWSQEIRSLANQLGGAGVWIEKVKLRTTDPNDDESIEESLSRLPDGAIDELRTLFRTTARSGGSELIDSVMSDVSRKLPTELGRLVPLDDADWVRGVIADAETRLLGGLMDGEDDA